MILTSILASFWDPIGPSSIRNEPRDRLESVLGRRSWPLGRQGSRRGRPLGTRGHRKGAIGSSGAVLGQPRRVPGLPRAAFLAARFAAVVLFKNDSFYLKPVGP